MIITRIPPSPTGPLHVGTARTALYNYLFTKKQGGQMIMRIEDTDKERSKKEYEDNIINGLKRLGLSWDDGPYRQSDRTELYKKYLDELIQKNSAYYCFCSKEDLEQMHREQQATNQAPRYIGGCNELDPANSIKRISEGESAVVRLRVTPGTEITWNDLVRGEITIHSKELDDFVIARSGGDPLYHLTVVVDDHEMQVSHVIRGEDHISNTPKQMLLFQAFGWDSPAYAHLPLILNEDKTKLSKRKNKVSVDDYLDEGFLPEAIINYLALLGWNTPDEQELFTLDELIEKFDLNQVHKGGAVFDIKRLEWMNGEYIRREIVQDPDSFYQKALPFMDSLPDKPDLIKTMLLDSDFEGRFKRLTDIEKELHIFFEPLPPYDKSLLLNDKFKVTPDIADEVLEAAKEKFQALNWQIGQEGYNSEIKEALKPLMQELNYKPGQIFNTIRAALSGMEKSPNFSTLALYLGKDETLSRIDFALSKIKE